MEHFALVILLLIPVYVSFFWAVNLYLPFPRKGDPRRMLGRIMVTAIVIFVAHFLYLMRMHEAYLWIDALNTYASLSLYPMYYIYVLMLVKNDSPALKYRVYYLLPSVIFFFLVLAGYIIMGKNEVYAYISEVIYGMQSSSVGIAYMRVITQISRAVFLVQLFVFGYLIFNRTREYQKLLEERYSFTEKMSVRWVHSVNIFLFLTMIISVVYTLAGRMIFIDSELRIIAPVIVFSVMMYIAGYLGSRHVRVVMPEERYTVSTVEDRIPARLKTDLLALFENDKIYLQKYLTIWDVTAKLGTNRTYVSKIINNDLGFSFTVFVNNYRVDHIISLLERYHYYTADQLAEMSGFGSVISLHRAFYIREKTTLAEYRKRVRLNTLQGGD